MACAGEVGQLGLRVGGGIIERDGETALTVKSVVIRDLDQLVPRRRAVKRRGRGQEIRVSHAAPRGSGDLVRAELRFALCDQRLVLVARIGRSGYGGVGGRGGLDRLFRGTDDRVGLGFRRRLGERRRLRGGPGGRFGICARGRIRARRHVRLVIVVLRGRLNDRNDRARGQNRREKKDQRQKQDQRFFENIHGRNSFRIWIIRGRTGRGATYSSSRNSCWYSR